MDNAAELKAIRELLGWTQKQFGEAMHLGTTYINSLENRKRATADHIIEKAREVVRREQERSLNSTDQGQLRLKIRDYLEKVIESCKEDRDRLSWLYVELQRQFPVAEVKPSDLATEEKKKVEEVMKVVKATQTSVLSQDSNKDTHHSAGKPGK